MEKRIFSKQPVERYENIYFGKTIWGSGEGVHFFIFFFIFFEICAVQRQSPMLLMIAFLFLFFFFRA